MGGSYGTEAVAAAADPAGWELWPAPEGRHEAVYQHFPEFTCLCPRSGYPDFAAVHLVTVPDRKVVELKHLKLWLNGFRDRRVSHEATAVEILDTLVATLDPHHAFVLMEYTPRGNLTTFPMVEHLRPRAAALADDDPLGLALANARHVKHRLVDRALDRVRP